MPVVAVEVRKFRRTGFRLVGSRNARVDEACARRDACDPRKRKRHTGRNEVSASVRTPGFYKKLIPRRGFQAAASGGRAARIYCAEFKLQVAGAGLQPKR